MRSLLLLPGDDDRKLAEGLGSGADALLVDLADFVAPGRKPEARRIAAGFLREVGKLERRPRLFVRINAHGSGLAGDDLDGIMPAGPDGIVLPRCRSGDDVSLLAAKLAVREAENDLPDGATAVIAVAAETAASIFHMGSYAGISRRLIGLTWDAGNLSAELGADSGRRAGGGFADPHRLARSLCLFAAAAAGAAAIDTFYPDPGDPDGLRAEAEAARRDGFKAKMAIDPEQVAVINAVFASSAANQAAGD